MSDNSAGLKHGSPSTYGNHRCRCESCRSAHAAEIVRRREECRAQRVLIAGVLVHPLANHGTDNGYVYYGCRCQRCREAHAAAARARRGAR